MSEYIFQFFALQKCTQIFTDSMAATLPISVQFIENPVNQTFSINRLTVIFLIANKGWEIE